MSTVGITTSNDTTVKQRLKELITEYKAIYLEWKYCPELLPKKYKTFEELKADYKMIPKGVTESQAEQYLLEEQVQNALKVLLKAMHQKKMIELYNIYYEKAKEDTNAFKAFIDFSSTFFGNGTESELQAILKGIKIDE